MPFAILIAASLSFGRITTDLTPVAAALDKTIASLHEKSYRVVVTNEYGKTDQPDKVESLFTHAVTEAGHYYAREKYPLEVNVTCFTRDHSFEVLPAKNGWLLSRILKHSDEEARYQNFSWEAFAGLFCFEQKPLSHFVPSPHVQSAAIVVTPNRTVIWGRSKNSLTEGDVTSFLATVRFYGARRKAYFEESEIRYLSRTISYDSKTKSNVRVEADSLVFLSGLEVKTYYHGCQTEDDIRNCKNASTLRIRREANTDVAISETQLTPEYYGFDRRTMHQVLNAHVPLAKSSHSSGDYDLVLAILIPVGFLGLLYLVIRKT
jgi:hypothetical protein